MADDTFTTAATLTDLSLSPEEAAVFAINTDGLTGWVFSRVNKKFTQFRLESKK